MAPTKSAFASTAPKPSQKRNLSDLASDTDSEAPILPTKKAKGPTKSTTAGTPSTITSSYTANDLTHLSHAELIAHVLDLQKQLDDIKKSSTLSSSIRSNNAPELDPHDLHKKVELLRALIARQIKKAMVWKPSCKTGSASFSQDFVVPHPQVMTKLFARVTKDANNNKNGKAWKMKKLSAADFEVRTNSPSTYSRLLSIERETVNDTCILLHK